LISLVLLVLSVQADDFKGQKVTLGKRKCTCDFRLDMKETCKGTAKCDKKCSGAGKVEVGGCSFALQVKKGNGKISKCTCQAAQPTIGPITGSGSGPQPPTGSGSGPSPPIGSGSGEQPVPLPGSGSGPGPQPPAGGEGMQCACKCDCPPGSGECDCDCNCPMNSQAVNCAPGFSKVCPMMGDQCPQSMEQVCPSMPTTMPMPAGRMMGAGDRGCQCVPDFLLSLVMGAMTPAGRSAAVDRAMTKVTFKIGKTTCKCQYDINEKDCKRSKFACDKKCNGKISGLELDGGNYVMNLMVKKGKVAIQKCEAKTTEPTGTGGGPGSGPGNGGGSGMGSGPGSGIGGGMGGMGTRCACVSMGGGPMPPTGSGSGPMPPTGSGPNPPTGSGSGSGPQPPTGSGDLLLRRLPPSTYPLAKCNDGTQATYYAQPGRHTGKVMIWLQGGGACWSKGNCRERCASSNPESELCTAQTVREITFPEDHIKANAYKDYWTVYVHYCSSDLWSGTRSASQATAGFNFHGKNIVEAVVQDLIDNSNLLAATKVVLTGCSAGAAGVTFNCDDVAARLPNADFRCVADAPDFFPPSTSISPGCFARDPEFQNKGTQFWGRIYDKSCQSYADTNNVKNIGELCGTQARTLPFVTTPFLLMTPYFDPVIAAIHGCMEEYEGQGGAALRRFKSRWVNGMKAELGSLKSSKTDLSLFVPNCDIHCMTWDVQKMKVKQQTQHQFISSWLASDGRTAQYAMDEPDAQNPTCDVD